MKFAADTHAILWWFTDSPKISPKARSIFEDCEDGENIIFIPSIVMAEALSIFDKKRLAFDFKRLLHRMNESERFIIVPLDYSVLLKMAELTDIPELHDKIIAATASYLNCPIITKDTALHGLSHIKTVW